MLSLYHKWECRPIAPFQDYPWDYWILNFRIQMELRKHTICIFGHILARDIPWILGLIYGRFLQFRFLNWQLIHQYYDPGIKNPSCYLVHGLWSINIHSLTPIIPCNPGIFHMSFGGKTPLSGAHSPKWLYRWSHSVCASFLMSSNTHTQYPLVMSK